MLFCAFCTYKLVPFEDIPRPSGPPTRFLDVIGRITAVSDVVTIQSMHQPEPSNTRTIILTDLQGKELKLVLWGDRAIEFEEEAVRARDEKEAVIAIFVGTLPKINQGVQGLSGSSACRWYIDEDLPVINDFRNRLGTNFKPIDNDAALAENAFPTRIYADPVEKTVSELLQLNPYENEEKRFICAVTVQRLNPDQRWWFFSCSACNKTSTMLASHYRCGNPNCSSITAQETYCLSVFASDDVSEAEFTMFDKVGKAAVGKPLLPLLKFTNLGLSTTQEIARVPMVDRIAPPEVTQIVGQKYKLLVSISKRSFATRSTQLSFQVVKIMETYKPELSSSAFDCVPGASGASSSASLTDSPVPSEMFTPNTPSIQQARPGSSSGSLAIACPSPTGAAQTPTSKLNVGLLSSASPGKSPCPPSSARRALFPSNKNKLPLAEDLSKKLDEIETENDDNRVADPSSAAEEKDDKSPAPKNKRNPAAGKGAGGGKKTKQ